MPSAEQLRQQAFELMRRAADLEQGKAPPSPTVEDLWDRYTKAKAKHIARWTTVECLMRPVIKKLGDRAASSLRRADIEKYISERLDEKTDRKRPPSACTVNHEVTRLIAVLNFAFDERLIQANPIRRRPHVPVQKQRRPDWTEDDIAHLLSCAEEMWFRSMILVRLHTGLRPGEARAMRWEWVCLEQRCIRLPASATKTRVARSVSLTDEAAEALDALPRGEFVFAQPNGKPWGAVAVYNRWRHTIEASGLERRHGSRITFHALRAVYINTARRRGVPIETRAAQVGHVDLATQGYYTEVTEGDLRHGADRFEDGARRERRGPRRASHRRETHHRRTA